MTSPTPSTEFHRVYLGGLTPCGDVRIPPELKALAKARAGQRSLALGCGVGRFARWLAEQGVHATGVDFSPVAIEKARARGRNFADLRYEVADVTALPNLDGPFDLAFDVGCYPCLTPERQRANAATIGPQMRPGALLLIWALDKTPADERLDGASMADNMAPHFTLQSATANRRRIIASHWYHLRRSA